MDYCVKKLFLLLLLSFGLIGTAPANILDNNILKMKILNNCEECNLQGVDLSNKYLRVVNLSGANLRDANLSGSDLRLAKFFNADLSGADLSGADLSEADLRNANLRGTILCNTESSSDTDDPRC